VVTGTPRAAASLVASLGELGVATVHEAAGRTGFLGAELRPLFPGASIAGTAVTVLCPPGDNLMVHVAIEQAGPGDILVITTTSPCTDGYVGELITTSLAARGIVGLVTTTGVRDIAAITMAGFPVWSRSVSAQGTVKATAGSVNVPVSIGGTLVSPGDVVVADDDGVVVVPRLNGSSVASAGRERASREDAARLAYARGELSLDRNDLRPLVERLGVRYVPAGEFQAGFPAGFPAGQD
jgi:4-hydroxy-4-methyl-2-oxoglutarate aldolase